MIGSMLAQLEQLSDAFLAMPRPSMDEVEQYMATRDELFAQLKQLQNLHAAKVHDPAVEACVLRVVANDERVVQVMEALRMEAKDELQKLMVGKAVKQAYDDFGGEPDSLFIDKRR